MTVNSIYYCCSFMHTKRLAKSQVHSQLRYRSDAANLQSPTSWLAWTKILLTSLLQVSATITSDTDCKRNRHSDSTKCFYERNIVSTFKYISKLPHRKQAPWRPLANSALINWASTFSKHNFQWLENLLSADAISTYVYLHFQQMTQLVMSKAQCDTGQDKLAWIMDSRQATCAAMKRELTMPASNQLQHLLATHHQHQRHQSKQR